MFFLLTKNYLINVDEIQTLTKINKITNRAAMLVLLMGTNISIKKRIGLHPSILAASTISSGIVIKNCLNKKVAVADAINGKINPV